MGDNAEQTPDGEIGIRQRLARPRRSRLLRAVSILLFVSALSNFILLATPAVNQFGLTYPPVAFIAALVTGLAAIGVWQQKRWGAYLYFGLAILTQPILLLMGFWNWAAVVVPGIIVLLLALRLKVMTPGMPIKGTT